MFESAPPCKTDSAPREPEPTLRLLLTDVLRSGLNLLDRMRSSWDSKGRSLWQSGTVLVDRVQIAAADTLGWLAGRVVRWADSVHGYVAPLAAVEDVADIQQAAAEIKELVAELDPYSPANDMKIAGALDRVAECLAILVDKTDAVSQQHEQVAQQGVDLTRQMGIHIGKVRGDMQRLGTRVTTQGEVQSKGMQSHFEKVTARLDRKVSSNETGRALEDEASRELEISVFGWIETQGGGMRSRVRWNDRMPPDRWPRLARRLGLPVQAPALERCDMLLEIGDYRTPHAVFVVGEVTTRMDMRRVHKVITARRLLWEAGFEAVGILWCMGVSPHGVGKCADRDIVVMEAARDAQGALYWQGQAGLAAAVDTAWAHTHRRR